MSTNLHIIQPTAAEKIREIVAWMQSTSEDERRRFLLLMRTAITPPTLPTTPLGGGYDVIRTASRLTTKPLRAVLAVHLILLSVMAAVVLVLAYVRQHLGVGI